MTLNKEVIKIEEREHILNILLKTREALRKKDYFNIKSLSDKVIHHASVHQDFNVISIAVIIYSLSKLIERESYRTEKNWGRFYDRYYMNIENLISALKNKDIEKFHSQIVSNRELIEGLSGKLKFYISEVFRRAKINKASRIYEHGISMEKTAKILGISLWELSEYTGKTGIADVNLALTLPIKERIKIAEEVFR